MTTPPPTTPPSTTPPPTHDQRYRRLSPLTPLVRGSIFFVAVLGATWRDLGSGRPGPFALILLGVLLAGFVYGYTSWLRTRYWIQDDELRVDTGVITRQSRRIRIDRLQGVDIVQPFVARLFGLAELKMDVAGGGRGEGSLAFLPVSEAHELKRVLLARRAVDRAEVVGAEPTDAADPPDAHPDRLVARLDLVQLVASLVLSPEFIAFVLSGGAVLVLSLTVGSFGVATGFIPVVTGFGVVVVRRLAGFYNFTVTDTAAGLQVRRGLFELTSQTVALHRVQGVVVTEPVLWRILGWARLDVSVAGTTKDADDNSKLLASTVLPVGDLAQVLELARHVLGGVPVGEVPLSPPPARAGWLAPVGRHFMAAGLDERLLVSRRGWFQRRTTAVPHRRVQSLRLRQGPLERRLRLATLIVDSPPGPAQVRLALRDAATIRPLLEHAADLARRARSR